MLREWEKLPKFMQTEEVRPYYDSLKKKKISLALKRGFDVFAAFTGGISEFLLASAVDPVSPAASAPLPASKV